MVIRARRTAVGARKPLGVASREDTCHFCGTPDAQYGRREDNVPRGEYKPACFKCAGRPYPVPKQFREKRK